MRFAPLASLHPRCREVQPTHLDKLAAAWLRAGLALNGSWWVNPTGTAYLGHLFIGLSSLSERVQRDRLGR